MKLESEQNMLSGIPWACVPDARYAWGRHPEKPLACE